MLPTHQAPEKGQLVHTGAHPDVSAGWNFLQPGVLSEPALHVCSVG